VPGRRSESTTQNFVTRRSLVKALGSSQAVDRHLVDDISTTADDVVAAYTGDTAWHNDGIDWIMIRGIDEVDDQRTAGDALETAAINAALFVVNTIDSGALDASRWRPQADLLIRNTTADANGSPDETDPPSPAGQIRPSGA
jgi:hypothetical protein